MEASHKSNVERNLGV